MGLKTKRKNVTYLQIREGNLVKRVNEATSTSVERKISKGKNEGKTVHEEHFQAIEGILIGIYKRESEVTFQPDPLVTLEVIIKDDEDGSIFQITVPFSSAYTRGILTKVEKIDLDQPIELNTYWIEGDDKKYRGFIGINQYGEKVESLYSKDDGIMPAVEVVKVGKKTIYNDEKLLEFYDEILRKISPKFEIKGDVTEKPDEVPNEVKKDAKSHTMPEIDDKSQDDFTEDVPF